MEKRLILAVNPGSTSTKVALFEEEKLIFEKSKSYKSGFTGFEKITDQFHFRKT